jgi:hypothetical protein
MSDRAMEMAMELFRSNEEFRRRVMGAPDGQKGATVNRILPEYAPPVNQEKLAGAADEGLTPEEQQTINDQPWTEGDDALLAKIGQAGCTYT